MEIVELVRAVLTAALQLMERMVQMVRMEAKEPTALQDKLAKMAFVLIHLVTNLPMV